MKPTQLLPIWVNNRNETSVYGILGLSAPVIRQLCQDWIDLAALKAIANGNAPRNCHGYARIPRVALESHNLSLDIDNTPEGHANIIDWPQEYEDRLEIVNDLILNAEKFRPKVAPQIQD